MSACVCWFFTEDGSDITGPEGKGTWSPVVVTASVWLLAVWVLLGGAVRHGVVLRDQLSEASKKAVCPVKAKHLSCLISQRSVYRRGVQQEFASLSVSFLHSDTTSFKAARNFNFFIH